jgi:hypothetical protein
MSDPVVTGRDALNHWNGYPWYDAKTDGLRRVEVSQPWDPNWDWSFHFPASMLQWAAWIVIGLLLALAAYLLIRAFLRRDRTEGKSEEDLVGNAARVESLPLPVDARHLDLLAEARRCRQQGDFAQAIIFLFSHQLLQLDKHGRIYLARGKTNRQYLREIHPWPALGKLIEQTMQVFEDVFFGHHPIEQPTFEACWSRLEEFEELVGSG